MALEKLKEAICSRRLESGDTVKVLKGGDWPAYDHPLGGEGRWAVYIDTKRNKAIVRPLIDGTTGPKVEVEQVQHIDDTIKDVAISEYKQRRLRPKNGIKAQ